MSGPIQQGFFVEEVVKRLKRSKLGQPKPPKSADPYTDRPRVRSSGNPDTAKVVVVGEMPGDVELQQGEAFVGESGQLLRRILAEEARLNPTREVYFGNVIPYRLEELKTDVEKIRAGKRTVRYFLEELEALPGCPVIGVGAIALRVVTGDRGITGERGIMHRLPDGRLFFPTYHPAHILRADAQVRPRLERTFRADLRKFGEWFRRPKAGPIGKMVSTERELSQVEAYLVKQPLLFFDFETLGLSAWAERPGEGRVQAAGFCCRPGEAFGIPVDCEDGPLNPVVAKAAVGRILASSAEKGGLHLQHDLHWGRMAGFEIRNVRWDDMLAATLLADRPYIEIRSNLLRLAADWIGEIEYPWLHVDKSRMAEYDAATVCGVAATDAEWELRIHLALMAELERRI